MERTKLQVYLKAVLDVESALYAHQKIEEDYATTAQRNKPKPPERRKIEPPVRPEKPQRKLLPTASNSDEAIDNIGDYIQYAIDDSCPLPILIVCLAVAFAVLCILPDFFAPTLGAIIIFAAVIFNIVIFSTAKYYYKIQFVLGFLFSVAIPLASVIAKALGGGTTFLCCVVVGGISFAYARFDYKKYQNRNSMKADADYSSALKVYEAKSKQYDIDYLDWQKKCNTEKERYAKASKSYEDDSIKYQLSFNNTTAQLRKAKTKLLLARDKLYAQNIIYEKYRNLVCVATLYEYISSGRCYELEGPNGAYNLYELELRQNIIITSLSTIISNLQQIQSNQYYLFQELQTANQLATQTVNGLMSIDANTKLTAYYAKAAAVAASADRYIVGVTYTY